MMRSFMFNFLTIVIPCLWIHVDLQGSSEEPTNIIETISLEKNNTNPESASQKQSNSQALDDCIKLRAAAVGFHVGHRRAS